MVPHLPTVLGIGKMNVVQFHRHEEIPVDQDMGRKDRQNGNISAGILHCCNSQSLESAHLSGFGHISYQTLEGGKSKAPLENRSCCSASSSPDSSMSRTL